MATNKDFNVSPWYDDYDDAVGQNGDHYRVLYRPGRSIQAREATQSQTILQKQIERFGEHVFTQGSKVTGANQTLDVDAKYAKLEPQFNSVDITVSNFLDQTFVGKKSLARANVFHTETLTTDDANAIYLKYTSGDQFKVLIFTGTITSTFLAGETVTGGTSTATGIVRRWDATNKIMWITQTDTDTAIDFTTGETVTSTASNGTDSESSGSGALATTDFLGNSGEFFPGEEILSAIPKLTATVTPTGTFEIGDMVTGSSSSATGQVVKFDSAAKELQIIPVSGTFTTSDTVTSVATAGAFKVSGTASMVVTAVSNLTATYNATIGGGSSSSITNETGTGTLYSIDEGVFFVNGFFAKVASQTISLEKFGITETHRVGLAMTESTIDSNDDSSLLDNAQGSANENAPGADRYKITLTLTRLSATATTGDEKFIELVKVKEAVSQDITEFPIYSELGKTFARRTFDESGNYTVRDFRHHVEDHSTDNDKFISKLATGKAYIQGQEHTIIVPEEIEHDRARTFASVSDGDTLAQYGSYILVDTAKGSASNFFDVTSHAIVEMHCVLNTNITLTNDETYLRTLAGTARIRHFGQATADPADSSTPGSEDYRMYLYDMKFHSILGTAQAGASSTVTLDSAEDDTNDAYNGATVDIIAGTGSGQSRIITDYVGSSKVATVGTAWSTTPSTDSIYRVTFTLKNIQSVVAVTAYTRLTAPVVVEVAADIADAGRHNATGSSTVTREAIYKTNTISGDAHGDAKLFETDVNGLVFAIGESNIKEISANTATYQFQRKFTDQTFSAGLLTLTAPTSEEFYTGSSALSDSNKNEAYVLIHKSGSVGSTSLAAGDLIDMTASGRTITPTEVSRQVTFEMNDGSYTGTVDILARMSVSSTGAEPRSKTLSSNVAVTNVEVNADNNFTASLGYSDVDSLVSVIDTGNSSADVTSSYVLDNGQKDNWYDHGKIRKKLDGVAITGPLTVTFKNFTHSGNGYCSVNSYSGVDYENITEYTSPTSGNIVPLGDAIDFRPRRPDESGTDHREFKTTHGTATAGTTNTITLHNSAVLTSATDDAYNDAVITIIDGTGKGQVRRIADYVGSTRVATLNSPWDVTPSSDSKYIIEDREFTPANIEIPYPNTNWTADYDYYLSRIDVIYITSEGRFGVTKGIPAIDPKQVAELENSMSIYVLYVPAYTANTSNIISRRIDNKRYTMKDIGKFEDRLNRLEYYTSLSLLERDAATELVKDDVGVERFKNGIIVDNFTGHGVGDVLSENYTASIDFQEQILRPPFTSNHIDLSSSYDSTTSSSGVTKTGDLITLAYTTEVMVDQIQATQGTNLNPYLVLPFIGNLSLNPPVDYWVDTTTRPTVNVNLTGDFDGWASATNLGFGTQWNDWESISISRRADDIDTRTVALSGPEPSNGDGSELFTRNLNVTRQMSTIAEQQSRTGIRTTVIPRTVTENFGDRVIDVNVQPFIRAQSITVTVTSMKPNTRVWPFFDGNAVSTVCTPSGGSAGDPIYTDQNGAVTVTFALPAGTYRTGDRLFRLIDSSSDSLSGSSTRAEDIFHAQGLSQTKEGVTVSTRVPEFRTENITDVRTVTRTDRSTIFSEELHSAGWDQAGPDPLAQSFHIHGGQYPGGVFIASVDCYFKTKDDEGIPVTVTIREMVNGIPTQIIVPFSEKTLTPDAVNVTATGPQSDSSVSSLTATTFTFDSPIYLAPGEYALVLFSTSKKYESWSAKMGEVREDVTGTRRVTEQPHMGTMFHSQNQRTWTPEQWEDVTFRINKCVFGITGTNTAQFINPASTPSSVVRYDTYQLSAKTIEDGIRTNITWGVRERKQSAGNGTANYPSTTTYTSTIANRNTDIIDDQRIITATSGSWVGQATLTSLDTNVSPVIDVKQLFLVAVENLVNSFTTDETNSYATLPDGNFPIGVTIGSDSSDTASGGPRARYITRRVTLADGFDAQDIAVFLTANKPPSAGITVYYKVLSSEDESEFNSRGWVAMEQASSTNITARFRTNEFHEYRYQASTSPIVYINPDSGVSYTSFKTFAIKIVMTSSNTNFVPKIRDLRVIAVDRGRA